MNYIAHVFANLASCLTSRVGYVQKVRTACCESGAKSHFAQWRVRCLEVI